MYNKLTYRKTKPKVFYDTIKLLEKINTANKNINKYERMTILEPYVLNKLASSLKIVAKLNISKTITSQEKQKKLEEVILYIDLAREFFIFFTENKNLKYSINFTYEINTDFETIIKQLHGWKKSI